MRTIVLVLVVAVCCGAACAAEKDSGLVLHYTFDEGADTTVRDKSGHGNDGTITGKVDWVQKQSYTALRFNGKDTQIECPPSESLNLSRTGSLEIWCLPDTIQGGLISWYTTVPAGSIWTWAEMRLSLEFSQHWFHGSALTGHMSNGEESWGGIRDFNWKFNHIPETGEWSHFVLTFDGEWMRIYRNGRQCALSPQEVFTNIKDVPLRIGISEGDCGGIFRGLISEVRIYNRALPAKKIAAKYLSRAQAMGHKKIIPLTPRLYAARGELVVETDLLRLTPLPANAHVKMELRDAEDRLVHPVARKVAPDADTTSVKFDTHTLKAGSYEIRAVAVGPDGNAISETAVKKWEFPVTAQLLGAKPGTKILNNLVTELVKLDSVPSKPSYREIPFNNPREGWIFVSASTRVQNGDVIAISIDADKEDAVLNYRSGEATTKETMRFIEAGEHKLRIWFSEKSGSSEVGLQNLTVRTVPAMIYCGFLGKSRGYFGEYDKEFLAKDVLPNINTIVGKGDVKYQDIQKEWKQRGGKWYIEQNLPTLHRDPESEDAPNPLTADYIYNFWTKSLGFTNPYLDGIYVDEFIWSDSHPDYPAYIEALERIANDKAFKGKAVQGWVGADIHYSGWGQDVMNTLISCGYKIGWEAYYSEMANETVAREFLRLQERDKMDGLEKAVPGILKDFVYVLGGFMSTPPLSLNTDPQVDFKVWLDMKFNYLANAPECFGLYGIMQYHAIFADEEYLRWCGRLFRHYGIEGKTGMLSDEYGFKYELDHIQNANFTDGLKNWTVAEAAPKSVRVGKILKLNNMLGFLYPPLHTGNEHLWTKRSAEKPNRVSQEIKNLTPGKLYSAKLYAADYQDYVKGESVRKKLAISINIDNVDMVPSKRLALEVDGISRCCAGSFEGKEPPWMSVHRLVFRAKKPTALLTISDWPDDATPGGPIGQEILYNFVEVQPYLED